jgi:S-adenosylmethionine hydrolase
VPPPFIAFLTDYGLEDDFVGICHGVIARACPDARVIDVTHGIPRHDVRRAAIVLRNSLRFMPDAVHLTVVDPEVGGERRAVALRLADGRLLVGPDNGVLMPAGEKGGGIVEAVDIGRSPFRLEPVSATFHGRDIFSPVAAQLAGGVPLAACGEPLDPAALTTLQLPSPRRLEAGGLAVHALVIDRFGNVTLDAGHEDLGETGLRLGRRVHVELLGGEFSALYATTFADVPPDELLLYEDGYRALALAINRGSAAGALGLRPDDELLLRPA